MLQISSTFSETTLTANPVAGLTLTLVLADTDSFISQIAGAIDWGDGQSTDLGTVANPYGPSALVHAYAPGVFQVRITARNFKTPSPQTALVQQKITVTAAGAVQTTAAPVIFGPILPRTQGFPAPADWNFNTGRDGIILESSLLMLFLTAKGERVYDFEYGSNLRRLVFALDDLDLTASVRQEIAQAVARNEPRVELVASSVERSRQGRSVQVNAEFLSRLSRQPLVLNLAFAP